MLCEAVFGEFQKKTVLVVDYIPSANHCTSTIPLESTMDFSELTVSFFETDNSFI